MNGIVPPLLVLTSLLPALVIFALAEEQRLLRTTVNLLGAATKVVLVVVMLVGVANGMSFEWRYELFAGIDLALAASKPALLFVSLSAFLWLLTTIYAIGYLEGSPHRSRFFGYFSLCVASTMGIALADNMLTFLIFFELLTISTWPLIVHRGTDEARRAGNVYLASLVGGGTVLLVGIVWLYATVGAVELTPGGAITDAAGNETALRWIFWLMVIGLGVKAAIVPLHGWLPRAMVAPAPVSALLHAVAVVKAGAYGISRVVLDLYGIDLAGDLGLLTPLAVIASVTIIYASLRAIAQDELKRRLAFSTVSQVSYIILGVALASSVAVTAGLVHLVHQGLMKVTLFYCAGNVAERHGVHRISEMRGLGHRMPVTMMAFTVAAIGMIGLPPTAGFITKWYLGTGAVAAGQAWVIPVLMLSTMLNAAYFLPVIATIWRNPPADVAAADAPSRPVGRLRAGAGTWQPQRPAIEEAPAMLVVPAAITAAASVFVAIVAASRVSPLTWAELVARAAVGGAGGAP